MQRQVRSLILIGALTAAPGAGAASKGATLLPGLGHLHHPIATKSAEAQRFFDQGLSLVYSFNHEEAVRSFERAAKLDPNAPMPLWGVALALGPNINMAVDSASEKAAFDAVREAAALAAADGIPASERAYVGALAKRYSDAPDADLGRLARDYTRTMGEVVHAYPDDLDAATLYAESIMDLNPWKHWSLDGEPAEGTLEIVAVLESVLKRDPDHLGANHYYIHAIEASPHPEKALPCAARLAALAPGAGHIVHMPSHVYARTGDYMDAVKSNRAAAEVDRAYIRTTGAAGMYPLMYYSHNLHFLSSAACMTGRYAEARTAAGQLLVNIKPALGIDPMPADLLAYIEVFESTPNFVALRFRRWDDVLKSPKPDAKFPVANALWHFSRGLAQAGKGNPRAAEDERRAYLEARRVVPDDAGFGQNRAGVILDTAGRLLDGSIAEAQGNKDDAIEALEKAVAAEDKVAYDEPPNWYYPIRETLGGALLRYKRPQEAETVFRVDLDRNPRNPRSLFGLWKSLLAQERPEDAAWVKRQLDTAWKNAEVRLRVEDL